MCTCRVFINTCIRFFWKYFNHFEYWKFLSSILIFENLDRYSRFTTLFIRKKSESINRTKSKKIETEHETENTKQNTRGKIEQTKKKTQQKIKQDKSDKTIQIKQDREERKEIFSKNQYQILKQLIEK